MVIKEVAGYTLDFIQDIIYNNENSDLWKNSLKFLSYFEIETNAEIKNESSTPEFSVLDNILSRGIPTKASLFIENKIMDSIGWTKPLINKKIGKINYSINEQGLENKDLILKTLALIDPRLHPKEKIEDRLKFDIKTWEIHPDPGAEERFLYELLPDAISDEYVIQSIEPQREIKNILKFSKTQEDRFDIQYSNLIKNFHSQRTDFAIQFPETQNNIKNGIVIEIDGFHHNNPAQKILDELRDSTIRDIGWHPTQRIKTSELRRLPTQIINNIINFLNHPYSKLLKENYHNPIYLNPNGLKALQLTLTPFGISRVQKLIIKLINSGYLDLNSSKWNIAVIERDVPCVLMAIEDLKQQFKNLYLLNGNNISFPEINYKLLNTEEFKDCKLFENKDYEIYKDDIVINDFRADILIDISVLQKRGFTKPSESFISRLGNPKVFCLRSAYSPQKERKLAINKPLYYNNLIENNRISRKIKSAKYFLRNIFRKIGFRDGQIEILNRALSRKSVIALLPTGAGKSLTYQLASLLQPGITLVIDPIKSLMKDQNENLIRYGIDSTIIINSTIRSASERKDRIDKILKGCYQFVFISPERLQTDEFRDALLEMPNQQKYFSYCVIDEAHCVSEWGHDFRTAYLKLGENARKYCKTADEICIPLLGLTGTASFDVLSDVRRELGLEEDTESIIRPKSSERKELKLEVINANNAISTGNFWDDWKSYATAKNEALKKLLLNLPIQFNTDNNSFFSLTNHDTKCGLIFCPHVTNVYGVKNVSEYIRKTLAKFNIPIGVYAGSLGDDDAGAELLEITQEKFKENELSILVATKAFGMGINKPNIRYTIHFNMPHSIEAFYQESGRAGRDRNPAICYILYTGLPINGNITIDEYLWLSFWEKAFRGEEKEKRIIYELLDQITYPEVSLIENINEQISSELNLQISLNNFIKNNTAILYFNGLGYGQKYGFYDYNTNSITVQIANVNINHKDCETLLNRVFQFLKDNKPHNITLREWLTSVEFPQTQNGIERILDGITENDLPQIITIGFINDKIKRISDLLLNYDNIYTQTWVKKNSAFCRNYAEFKRKINNNNISPNDEIVLAKYFDRIRTEQDTFKAIYRLSIIGVIDEYSVDYKSKSLKIKIKKKPNAYYIEKLQKYISRYISTQKFLKVPEDVLGRPGNSIIQKCLGYLIDFIYKNIASKRKKAIEVMEQGCRIAINHGNNEFRLFVNTYFDSKYYVPLSEFLNDYDEKKLFDFINETEGTKDNLLHLRGACDRLLIENPENGLFNVLGATANLLYYDEPNEEMINNFRKGWQLIKDYLNLNQENYTKFYSNYYKIMYSYNNKIRVFLDRDILKIHYNWIKNNLTN